MWMLQLPNPQLPSKHNKKKDFNQIVCWTFPRSAVEIYISLWDSGKTRYSKPIACHTHQINWGDSLDKEAMVYIAFEMQWRM